MSANKIKISKTVALEKIERQITKGSVLAQAGIDFIKKNPNHSIHRSEVDKFEIEFEQWVNITGSIIFEIFDDYNYGSKFKDHISSKREYVSSDWQPDIKYYLERQLLPKLEYLKILKKNVIDLEEIEAENNITPEIKNDSIDKTNNEMPVSKIDLNTYDFSKITLPQLLNILTVPQIIKIITSIFALLVLAFWIGYYFHSFQSNQKLIDNIEILSKEIETLKMENQSLTKEFQSFKSDSLKNK